MIARQRIGPGPDPAADGRESLNPSNPASDEWAMRKEKRRFARARCRLDCTLHGDDRKVSGTVRDVSAGGLAVQTELGAGEGESLRVRVEPPIGEPVELDAIVWHSHRVRSRQSGAKGFMLGLVVSNPPEAWFTRVGAPRPDRGPSAGAVPEPEKSESAPSPPNCCDRELPSFLVRVKQTVSPRTRAYRVQAASLGEARAQAEGEAGDGWRVIEVRPA
jgi:hypothetical protein